MYETAGSGAPVSAPPTYQPLPPPPPPPPAVLWFKRLGPPARITLVMLALSAIVSAVMAVSDQMEIALLQDVRNGGFVTEEQALNNDDRVIAVGLIWFAVWVGTAVAFVVWTHRAYKNIPTIWRRRPDHSSGWAIGAWFVPFLAMWRPYGIVDEIWRSGEPGADPNDTYARKRKVSALLPVWWALWLGSAILGNIGSRMYTVAESPDEIIAANWVDFVSCMFTIPAAVLAGLVVWNATKRQEATAAQHRAATGVAPPLD